MFLAGATTPVYLPELDARIPLNQCTKWQLLNLDVDTACSISDDVCRYCGLTDNMLLNEKLEVVYQRHFDLIILY